MSFKIYDVDERTQKITKAKKVFMNRSRLRRSPEIKRPVKRIVFLIHWFGLPVLMIARIFCVNTIRKVTSDSHYHVWVDNSNTAPILH